MQTTNPDTNPLFIELKTHHKLLFKKILAGDDYFLCLPPQNQFRTRITESVLNSHIMKPSAFFSGQLVTLTGKEYNLKQDRLVSVTSPEESFSIVEQEDYYLGTFKLKMLYIDTRLDISVPKGSQRGRSAAANKFQEKYPDTFTMLTSGSVRSFLLSFEESLIIVRKIDEKLKEIKSNLPNLSHEALKAKIIETIEFASTNLAIGIRYIRYLSTHKRLEFEHLVESFVYQTLYDGLIPYISKIPLVAILNSQYHHVQLSVLTNLSQAQLGIRPELQYPYLEAINELEKLSSYTSPSAKLICVKETLRLVAETVQRYSKEVELCSDDIIPLLTWIFFQTQNPTPFTQLEMMQNFVYHDELKQEFSYYASTFECAIKYVLTQDFAKRIDRSFPWCSSSTKTYVVPPRDSGSLLSPKSRRLSTSSAPKVNLLLPSCRERSRSWGSKIPTILLAGNY
jgi:hypothetical protein